MDINVGDRIILEVSTFGDRFLGLVADLKPDGRLLVFADMPHPVLERLRIDTFALVRYALDGRLLGFNTRVLNLADPHGRLLELAAPSASFDAEERSEPRCTCSFPAFLVHGDTALRGVVEDMSASCTRIRYLDQGPEEFPEEKGKQVRLTFHPFDMNSTGYSVGCRVLKSFMKEGVRYAVLKFNNDEPDARERISGFIEAQVCCSIPRV
ncbi:PilZ domain-containing protein [Pseudodesulfovibrio indicus]|uniref:PilZ domain-containing protein n=1 Tax=Pseudodesulfovibrio indicus TaxID=1716143 RepID=UPI002931F664|nr:PilZ domain-containing protein [Pseudodesulfovibrio indicus]